MFIWQELDEIRAMSTGMARDHILELKKELVDIKLLEEMSKKDIRARVLNTAAIIDNRPLLFYEFISPYHYTQWVIYNQGTLI